MCGSCNRNRANNNRPFRPRVTLAPTQPTVNNPPQNQTLLNTQPIDPNSISDRKRIERLQREAIRRALGR